MGANPTLPTETGVGGASVHTPTSLLFRKGEIVSMKKILHKLFGLGRHQWKYTRKNGWDYSEPHDHSGDYLPTKWRQYKCKLCGLVKRKYWDGFTHLGTLPPRIYFYKEH